jgi:hypothetical protein
MKAIFVKYIPASNVKGSRLKAFDGDGNQVTVGYPHELSRSKMHRFAAESLVKKMGWSGHLVEGGHKNVTVFCFLESADSLIEVFKLLQEGKRDGTTMGKASLAYDRLKTDLGIEA